MIKKLEKITNEIAEMVSKIGEVLSVENIGQMSTDGEVVRMTFKVELEDSIENFVVDAYSDDVDVLVNDEKVEEGWKSFIITEIVEGIGLKELTSEVERMIKLYKDIEAEIER